MTKTLLTYKVTSKGQFKVKGQGQAQIGLMSNLSKTITKKVSE